MSEFHVRDSIPPQVVSGMLDPEISLSSIYDPFEQRVVAISLIAAIHAADSTPVTAHARFPEQFTSRLPAVAEFRKNHLSQGAVIDPHQVDGWIREQAIRDGEPSWWLMDVWVQAEEIERQERDGVTLVPGTKLHFEPAIAWTRLPKPGAAPAAPMERRFVEYATPLSARQQQAVRAGGVLDTLRLMSLYFGLIWGWTEAQGATFVLTGLAPFASNELVERVAIHHGRRPRPMSLKHLELAVFTERHASERSAARMAQWNEKYPDWAYENADQFSSDSARALRRLSGSLI